MEFVYCFKKYKKHIRKLKVFQIFQSCPKCSSKAIIGWGQYFRKCITGDAVEIIPIRRFRCKSCRKTFSYLPPFLIRYKRIYLAVIEAGIIKVIVKGISYLKAVGFEYDVSTLYRYTKYFLKKAEQIYEKTKRILLSLNPDIEYEKSFQAQNITHKKLQSQDLLAKAIKLWGFLAQILRNRLPELEELDVFTGIIYLQSR